MPKTTIITVDSSNVSEHGFYCLQNPKNPGHPLKMNWLEKNFDDGLRIKIACSNDGDQLGFIEYVPAEHAWRPVYAPGYMFIHCIILFRKQNQRKSIGSELLQECINDAIKKKMKGVVTFASDGPWIANKSLFLKNGFKAIDKLERFELMVKQFKKAPVPEFIDWTKNRRKYKGWNLIYANQCPFTIKSVDDLVQTSKQKGIELKVTELKTAKQAQKAPSGYGVYTLIKDGKLLADHYISNTRFLNILQKELNT